MCVHVCLFGLVCFLFFLFFVSTSLFQILELFNCFISAFIGVSRTHPPPHIQIENNISSPLCPVQSSRLALESVMLVVFGGQQPRLSLWAITAH